MNGWVPFLETRGERFHYFLPSCWTVWHVVALISLGCASEVLVFLVRASGYYGGRGQEPRGDWVMGDGHSVMRLGRLTIFDHLWPNKSNNHIQHGPICVSRIGADAWPMCERRNEISLPVKALLSAGASARIGWCSRISKGGHLS